MHVNRKPHFYSLLAGTAVFLFIFTAEFYFNFEVLSNYSTTILFVFLTSMWISLLISSIVYVKKFKDRKGLVVLGVLIITGVKFLFFALINLLVMF